MKYQVTLTKYEIYEVDAFSVEEAEDKAFYMCDHDEFAWLDPVDEVEVKPL